MKTDSKKELILNRTKRTLLFLVGILICALSYGQTRTINGSGNWSSTGNWQGGNVGGAVDNNDDVVMGNNIDIIVQNGDTYTVATLDVSKDGSITVDFGGTLVVTGDVDVDKDFTMSINGDFTVQGNMAIAKTLSLTVGVNGNMNVQGDATLAKDATLGVEGDLDIDGDFTAAQNTTINVGTSGTVNVDGSLTSGTNSVIDVGTGGTVTVGVDLDLDTGSTITGTGGVSAGDCVGAACTDSQLPITLSSFSGTSATNLVILDWATESEENFDYFDIERSLDGNNYESIGTVKGNGDSKTRIDYFFEDETPMFGLAYYRLTAIDLDGSFEIFSAISINHIPVELEVNIYPNPSNGSGFNLNFGLPTEAKTKSISIFDMFGSKVTEMHLSDNNTHIDSRLTKGVHIAKIQIDNYIITRKVIIKD